MTDFKITDLPLATELVGTELIEIVQSGVSKKAAITPVQWVTGDKKFTVASSGADFTTVMGAIAEAMKWRSTTGRVVVEIQSGYIVNEQLHFKYNDFSHIHITAQGGATIQINPSAMTVTDFESSGTSGFIACAYGASPIIEAKFNFTTKPSGTISGALSVLGRIYFGNNSGVKNCGYSGVTSYSNGSVSIGSACDFSMSGLFSLLASRGSVISAGNNNNFSGSGQDGVISHGGSHIKIGNDNIISGVSTGFSLAVEHGGLLQCGSGTVLTSGKERNQAGYTVTSKGLIVG